MVFTCCSVNGHVSEVRLSYFSSFLFFYSSLLLEVVTIKKDKTSLIQIQERCIEIELRLTGLA